MRLREIAAILHAETMGDDAVEIKRVAKIEEAVKGDIAFIANPKYEKFLGTTHASAVIVGKKMGHVDVEGSGTPPCLLPR